MYVVPFFVKAWGVIFCKGVRGQRGWSGSLRPGNNSELFLKVSAGPGHMLGS